ncbi:hypothetical protein DU504_08030 [Haloplanus salinus]|uniref:DUF7344 domain-containing protein n=1 Tax=Haloplanus salinus TaxID=1126245 RepID=A0A368N9N0_9EURY|nr:hypothetical protein DU504_08030 [Haloplanus salinus]
MTTSNANRRSDSTRDEPGRNRRRTDEERVDTIFRVLSDARRRRVIRLLRAREGAVAVSALAEALAAREPGDPEPERLVVSLQHVHLPKLEGAGVVDYTSDRSQVRYRDVALVDRLLEQL